MDKKTLDLKYTAISTLFTRFLRIVGLYALFRNVIKPIRFYNEVLHCGTCSMLSSRLFMNIAWNSFRHFRDVEEIFILSQLFRFYLLEHLEEVCKIYQIELDEASNIIVIHITANHLNNLMCEWLNNFKQGKKLKIDYEKLLRKN